VLADLTVQIAGKTHSGRSAGDSAASLLRKKWDDLVMRYMDEYEEVLNRSLSNLDHGEDTACFLLTNMFDCAFIGRSLNRAYWRENFWLLLGLNSFEIKIVFSRNVLDDLLCKSFKVGGCRPLLKG